MGGGGPSFQPVSSARDVQAENTLFGTAERGAEFLGRGVFDPIQEPLRQLGQALGGQIPASALPIANVMREESLLGQSQALEDITAQLAGAGGGRGQFGGNRLLAQTISDFARGRAQIPGRVISDVIRNFLPLAQQQVGQQAGIQQGALGASGQFNPLAAGRQAQAIQRIQAGQPPEQKSGAGIGTALGVGLPLALSAFGGPAGLAAAPAVSGGLSFGGRGPTGSFFS